MNLWQRLWQWFQQNEQVVYYIGGSDVLPAPLKGEEERTAIEALARGEEAARQTLVEHNLRLVVFIARRFESTAAFTLDVYGHVTEKMKRDSATRMQRFYESIRETNSSQ